MKRRAPTTISVVMLALALTGCSSSPPSDPSPSQEEPTRDVPAVADSHLVVDVTGEDVPTRDHVPTDEDSTLRTSSMTVTVEAIESTPAVSSDLVSDDGLGLDRGGMAVAADGEAFLVVTVATTETKGSNGAGDPVVGFELDRVPVLAPPLHPSESTTLLVSVPEYGQALLTVAEGEEVEKLNLADGKRDEKISSAE